MKMEARSSVGEKKRKKKKIKYKTSTSALQQSTDFYENIQILRKKII